MKHGELRKHVMSVLNAAGPWSAEGLTKADMAPEGRDPDCLDSVLQMLTLEGQIKKLPRTPGVPARKEPARWRITERGSKALTDGTLSATRGGARPNPRKAMRGMRGKRDWAADGVEEEARDTF